MDWHPLFVQAVKNDYSTRKLKRPHLSLRSYAPKIGLSSGALSDLLKQRKTWKISPERAREVLSHLQISSAEKNRILVLMGVAPLHSRQTLAEEEYRILTKWTYLAVLSSFDLPPHLSTPEAIGRRLGLAETVISEIIDYLIDKNLLIKDGNSIRRPSAFLESEDNIRPNSPPPKNVLLEHHKGNLELAQRSLYEHASHERDFTSLTFAGNSTQLDYLRTEIRKLYAKASSLTSSKSVPDQVFRLSIQLFPLEFK